jgi:hypothetical protein
MKLILHHYQELDGKDGVILYLLVSQQFADANMENLIEDYSQL